MASVFLVLSLGGGAKTTDRTLMGGGSSNWADVLTGQRTCRPLKTLAASATSHLVIRFGARQFRRGPW